MLEADHVVIGLGAIGSAACYALARAGADVIGVEQFELGHARGASHDHSRIIRRSYHTPEYVALAGAAYDAWARVEADPAAMADEPLVVRTGGIDLFPPDAAISIDDYVRAMIAAEVPFDVLDVAALERQWPQWRLPSGVRGLFQEDTGIVAAERATAAFRRGAVAAGARLLDSTPVRALAERDGHIVVDTNAGPIRAQRVVLACDAWTNHLLSDFGLRLPLVVTQEQVTYTRPVDLAAFAPERFPVWIWMDDPSYYGFPEFGEMGWVKSAQDCGGMEVTVQNRTFNPDPDDEARLMLFLAGVLPAACDGAARSKTCLYTLTPDRDFVIDSVPDHPDVLVALGAAHGFKFAALFGEILRDLALGHAPGHDLSSFRIDRPALTDPNATRTWLV